MAEGYMSLFAQDNTSGNKPHYRLLFRLDGVEHEAAFWPAKEGKRGFTGQFKPKQQRQPQQSNPIVDEEIAF